MSEYIHQSHNVSVLMYHLVCPATYRRVVFDASVDTVLKEVCLEIAKRYAIIFLEIGTDKDHVHFLIQSIPTYSPTKIVKTIKSITCNAQKSDMAIFPHSIGFRGNVLTPSRSSCYFNVLPPSCLIN